MAKPITWDTPGLRWDTPGLFWDGDMPAPRRMNNIKAIVDFTGYTAADLAPAAQAIHDGMTEFATSFPEPPATMAALATSIATFNSALATKASRATADIIAFNVARHELEELLSELGAYVNLIARGDATLVDNSGFPFYDTAHTPDTAPPAAPTDVRLRQGDLSGSLVARYRPARSRSMNEVQCCTGDPNLAVNWTHAGMFSGGKATLSGIVPGTTLWVRIRTAGIRGVMGAWSDPGKIMVV